MRNDDPVIVKVWQQWVRLCSSVKSAVVIWLILLAVISLITYIVLRIHTTYAVQRELALHKAQSEHLAGLIQTLDKDHEARLIELERTLYGEVQPKQELMSNQQQLPQSNSMRLSRIEIYQQNTNKEFRTRLEKLERWRMEVMERRPRE